MSVNEVRLTPWPTRMTSTTSPKPGDGGHPPIYRRSRPKKQKKNLSDRKTITLTYLHKGDKAIRVARLRRVVLKSVARRRTRRGKTITLEGKNTDRCGYRLKSTGFGDTAGRDVRGNYCELATPPRRIFSISWSRLMTHRTRAGQVTFVR